jgi:hypothetical protein
LSTQSVERICSRAMIPTTSHCWQQRLPLTTKSGTSCTAPSMGDCEGKEESRSWMEAQKNIEKIFGRQSGKTNELAARQTGNPHGSQTVQSSVLAEIHPRSPSPGLSLFHSLPHTHSVSSLCLCLSLSRGKVLSKIQMSTSTNNVPLGCLPRKVIESWMLAQIISI